MAFAECTSRSQPAHRCAWSAEQKTTAVLNAQTSHCTIGEVSPVWPLYIRVTLVNKRYAASQHGKGEHTCGGSYPFLEISNPDSDSPDTERLSVQRLLPRFYGLSARAARQYDTPRSSGIHLNKNEGQPSTTVDRPGRRKLY